MNAAKKSPTSNRFSEVRSLQIRECRLLTGGCWLIGTMSLWLPGRAGEKSLASRLFYGELAGRMDLGQLDEPGGNLYGWPTKLRSLRTCVQAAAGICSAMFIMFTMFMPPGRIGRFPRGWVSRRRMHFALDPAAFPESRRAKLHAEYFFCEESSRDCSRGLHHVLRGALFSRRCKCAPPPARRLKILAHLFLARASADCAPVDT
jgi:hypothetical protein